jgi:hypothetical protein
MAAENSDRTSACALSISYLEHTIVQVRMLKRKQEVYEK